MRKLKLQVQMSVDGHIAGANGEMNFIVWNWDDALKQYVNDLTDSVDSIVLGRKLAEGFIPHWASVAVNPDDPSFADGKRFTEMPKAIFTKTMETSEWPNTVLAKGDLADEIHALKKQSGKGIIAYGGASFVSALIRHGLIDEFHLFINPTILGKGMPIFQELESPQTLTLTNAMSFPCGIAVLHYESKRP